MDQGYEDAQTWAAAACYCPTCLRKGCPARDKSQRVPQKMGGLDECTRFGGGYEQDPEQIRDTMQTYLYRTREQRAEA